MGCHTLLASFGTSRTYSVILIITRIMRFMIITNNTNCAFALAHLTVPCRTDNTGPGRTQIASLSACTCPYMAWGFRAENSEFGCREVQFSISHIIVVDVIIIIITVLTVLVKTDNFGSFLGCFWTDFRPFYGFSAVSEWPFSCFSAMCRSKTVLEFSEITCSHKTNKYMKTRIHEFTVFARNVHIRSE